MLRQQPPRIAQGDNATLARWLLTTQDCAHSNTFQLTHQFLAYMPGVRRAGVTEGAVRLQAMALIQYGHGVLTVINRARQERAQ